MTNDDATSHPANAGNMQLIQLLLPLYDNEHRPFDRTLFDRVRSELTERFGGVTAFTRSPAMGLWEDDCGEVSRDDVILFEVMADRLEHVWWKEYRAHLEAAFRQDEIMIRASAVERL